MGVRGDSGAQPPAAPHQQPATHSPGSAHAPPWGEEPLRAVTARSIAGPTPAPGWCPAPRNTALEGRRGAGGGRHTRG